MAALICSFGIIIAVQGVYAVSPPEMLSTCGDPTAVAYRDTKCFKVLDNFLTWSQAFEACRSSAGQGSRLVTITSPDEQEFLTDFVFNSSSVQNNVWIGASRNSTVDPPTDFNLVDGKSLAEYANWAPDSPSDIGRDCVQMQSGLTRDDTPGLWKDVTCGLGNWAVCESFQIWTHYDTQLVVIELREAQLKINQLLKQVQNNPVPIGFIYVQLPRQPEPRSIWSQITWQDVTSAYAGQFFRAEGSGSAPFGENQGDYTRQISDVETKSRDYNDNYPHSIQVPATGWSPWVRTSYDADEGALHYESARYYHPNVEVRPKNTAIRLWKRTA